MKGQWSGAGPIKVFLINFCGGAEARSVAEKRQMQAGQRQPWKQWGGAGGLARLSQNKARGWERRGLVERFRDDSARVAGVEVWVSHCLCVNV